MVLSLNILPHFQHERFLHDGKVSPCDVLFIGDSLIRNMKETEVCNWVTIKIFCCYSVSASLLVIS